MTAARRFVAIGIVSTVAYLAMYAAFRTITSPALANAAALLVSAVGNTWANRRFTFGVQGRDGAARDHVGGLIAFGVALGVTTSSILALHSLAPNAGRNVEWLALVVANAFATVLRFVILRAWISRGDAMTELRPEGADR